MPKLAVAIPQCRQHSWIEGLLGSAGHSDAQQPDHGPAAAGACRLNGAGPSDWTKRQYAPRVAVMRWHPRNALHRLLELPGMGSSFAN